MKSRLKGRNKIKAVNARAVSLMRYDSGIVRGLKNVLEEVDRKTRRVMIMSKEIHTISDVDRLYVARVLLLREKNKQTFWNDKRKTSE